MLVIPLNSPEKTVIVVVLETDNLERMKQGDPVTLDSIQKGGTLYIQRPDNCHLVIAYEEDIEPIMKLAKNADIGGILKHLHRGFVFKEGLDGNENTKRVPLGDQTWN